MAQSNMPKSFCRAVQASSMTWRAVLRAYVVCYEAHSKDCARQTNKLFIWKFQRSHIWDVTALFQPLGLSLPDLPAPTPRWKGTMENGLSVHAGRTPSPRQTPAPGNSAADRQVLQVLGSCRFKVFEVTPLRLVSESTELGLGSGQTKKEASGDGLKLWQPGVCR